MEKCWYRRRRCRYSRYSLIWNSCGSTGESYKIQKLKDAGDLRKYYRYFGTKDDFMRFSIIVPVCNCIEFFEECISSVRSQTYADWEMLIVDDGSTDGSGEIADKYAELDSRISVIHNINEGAFFARQTGISAARGDYILFLDSDDILNYEALDLLADTVDRNKADMILFGGKRFGDPRNADNVIGVFSEDARYIEKKELYRLIASGNSCNSLCLKAIKRSLFEGDMTDYGKFRGFSIGEDKVRLLYPATKANSVLLLPEVLYNYRYNAVSAVHNITSEKLPYFMANNMFEMTYSYMKKWGMDDSESIEAISVYYIRQFLQVFYGYKKYCKAKKQQKYFRKYQWKEITDTRAFRYALSTKLTLKEKLKLTFALLHVYF